jgi:hypothetical protein
VPAVESLATRANKQICDTPQVNSSHSFNIISLRRPAFNKRTDAKLINDSILIQVVQPMTVRNSTIKAPAIGSWVPRATKEICNTPQVNSSHSFNIISLKRPGLMPRSPTANTDPAMV